MKFITFAVPCYNSAAYMEKCIDSLLVAGDDAEIIIVNDGSSDATAEIADRYAEKYPNIVKVIHKENGGHGSGVNAGLRNATGLYYKVVDSDDWLDAASLKHLLYMIKKLHALRKNVDAFMCNYVYEHVSDNTQHTMDYRNVFPKNRIFGWKDVGNFRLTQYMMMHTLIIKTQILRDAGICLPEHTFYVDIVFILESLPHIRRMCYLDIDLYRYFIGRDDQSVTTANLMRRIDQYLRVNDIVIKGYDMEAAKKIGKGLEHYITHHITVLSATVSTILTMIGDEEALAKREAYWENLKNNHPKIYKKIRYRTFAGMTNPPTKLGTKIVLKGYKISQKLVKYN
jgi:glycosyltransferase involved in cell wall biosynthesis